MRAETKLTRNDSGRKGGLTTLQRYGRDQLAEWGKRGGRPRSPTYDDIEAARLLERSKNNNKEVTDPPGDLNISQLRKRYKLRGRSNPIPEIVQAGTTQETPREAVPARKGSGIEETPP